MWEVMNTMTTREAFEAFISAPPFEMPTERFDDRCAWPGGYTELGVDLAWQAWKAAKATCPAWHDAPTVPGLWFCDEGDENPYRFTCHNVSIPLNPHLVGEGERWFGPIPPDGDKP